MAFVGARNATEEEIAVQKTREEKKEKGEKIEETQVVDRQPGMPTLMGVLHNPMTINENVIESHEGNPRVIEYAGEKKVLDLYKRYFWIPNGGPHASRPC